MMHIGLLGSYATYKPLESFHAKHVKKTFYAPKLGLGSLAGGGDVSAAGRELAAAIRARTMREFPRQCVLRDVERTLLPGLAQAGPDVLLVELLEERFGYVEIDGAVYTHTDYQRQVFSDLPLPFAPPRHIPPESAEAFALFTQGCAALFAGLPPGLRVVLVEHTLPEACYRDGRASPYPAPVLEPIRATNRLLAARYAHVAENYPVEVLSLPHERLIAAAPEKDGHALHDLSDASGDAVAQAIAQALQLEPYRLLSAPARVNQCIAAFAPLLEQAEVPGILELHAEGNRALAQGDIARSMQCERLIRLLHNSSVPLGLKLEDTQFAYGGIATIIHESAVIGRRVNIGSCVTIGGGRSIVRDGARRCVPTIEDHVYIATGAKLLGGITVGRYSIIGANAVVQTDVEPYSVYGGVPARKLRGITRENCAQYASYFHKGLPRQECLRLMFGEHADG